MTLDDETITVARIVPGRDGGTYRRSNIGPAWWATRGSEVRVRLRWSVRVVWWWAWFEPPELSGVAHTFAPVPHPSSRKGGALAMTAALCAIERANVTTCAEPLRYAIGANRQIAEATQLLLSALNAAVDDAARVGTTDTGARSAAAALLDARIAVHQAVTAAGRALADRERTVDVPAAGVFTLTAA
jgi:hypothetical protein